MHIHMHIHTCLYTCTAFVNLAWTFTTCMYMHMYACMYVHIHVQLEAFISHSGAAFYIYIYIYTYPSFVCTWSNSILTDRVRYDTSVHTRVNIYAQSWEPLHGVESPYMAFDGLDSSDREWALTIHYVCVKFVEAMSRKMLWCCNIFFFISLKKKVCHVWWSCRPKIEGTAPEKIGSHEKWHTEKLLEKSTKQTTKTLRGGLNSLSHSCSHSHSCSLYLCFAPKTA